jgi:hypothetical protein
MQHVTPLLMLIWPATLFPSQKDVPAEAVRPVTIYTQFAHPPAVVSIEEMKIELDAIMVPLDLQFDWRSLEQASGREASAELVVVSFKGECQSEWRPQQLQKGPLGWTHMADGAILPFADVDCDRIRDLMTHSLAMAVPPERARMLGRAMARVLAHELYHFLMNTTRHSSSGIAKASYTAAELTCPYLRFDDAHLRLPGQEKVHPPGGKTRGTAVQYGK